MSGNNLDSPTACLGLSGFEDLVFRQHPNPNARSTMAAMSLAFTPLAVDKPPLRVSDWPAARLTHADVKSCPKEDVLAAAAYAYSMVGTRVGMPLCTW